MRVFSEYNIEWRVTNVFNSNKGNAIELTNKVITYNKAPTDKEIHGTGLVSNVWNNFYIQRKIHCVHVK